MFSFFFFAWLYHCSVIKSASQLDTSLRKNVSGGVDIPHPSQILPSQICKVLGYELNFFSTTFGSATAPAIAERFCASFISGISRGLSVPLC